MEQQKMDNDLYFKKFRYQCDVGRFQYNNFTPVGYLLKLIVNDKEIKADTLVYDPEDSTRQLTVAALVERAAWDSTHFQDWNLEFECQISPQFRSSLLEAFCSSKVNPKMEAQWVIYAYDFNKQKYFRSFHTDDKSVSLTIPDKMETYISDRPNFDKLPTSFTMQISLLAKDKNQRVCFAFQADGKTFSLPIAE